MKRLCKDLNDYCGISVAQICLFQQTFGPEFESRVLQISSKPEIANVWKKRQFQLFDDLYYFIRKRIVNGGMRTVWPDKYRQMSVKVQKIAQNGHTACEVFIRTIGSQIEQANSYKLKILNYLYTSNNNTTNKTRSQSYKDFTA